MRLIALKEFVYQDKSLKVGDAFEAASTEDARILKGLGKAKDAPRTRAYQRRDMVSEG